MTKIFACLPIASGKTCLQTPPDGINWVEVLLAMGQSEKAQEVYEVLLKHTTDELEKGRLYDRLGMAHDNNGDYEEAIRFYEKSQEVLNKIQPPPLSDLAPSYNNIGKVYHNMDDHPKALSSHEKALAIKRQSLSPNHLDFRSSYSYIGLVYEHMNNYSKASSFYERAVKNGECCLPASHPTLQKHRNNLEKVKKKL